MAKSTARKTIAVTLPAEDFDLALKRWRASGGPERLAERLRDAEAAGNAFAQSTRVRPETLNDPVTL